MPQAGSRQAPIVYPPERYDKGLACREFLAAATLPYMQLLPQGFSTGIICRPGKLVCNKVRLAIPERRDNPCLSQGLWISNRGSTQARQATTGKC